MPRGRLVGYLEDPRTAPVVVLSAGPGWGKTTLLAQWAARSGRPFAWVAADETDNDPIRLMTHVAAALDRVSRLDPRVFEALASPGASVEAALMPRLGAALARMDEPVVLALDDLHLVDDPACLDAIAALARHVSQGSQLVLSARGRPVLPLGALRARGLATEIGPNDLRMDRDEARRLLGAGGVELPDDQVAQLCEQTEGWPAGLYLTAMSVRARGLSAGDTAASSGSDRRVSDYLRSEVLAHVSADDRFFLTRTAVLEQMCGPLCDAILERGGGAAGLESLARSNLFLEPLDGNREWYRYHRLFHELLRGELERDEPGLARSLLARATDWCEANGYPETAIAYAQKAGDVDRVARLVERCALPAYQSGRAQTAVSWLAWLAAHAKLERRGTVVVVGSMLAALQGRPAEAERCAAEAELAGYGGTLPDGSPAIDSWLALLRALRGQRGVPQMHADAEIAVRTLARGSQLRPMALLLLGVSQVRAGELDRADDLFADTAEEGLELGAPEAVALALAERASIAIGRGAWVEAGEFTERALQVIGRSRMEEYPTSALPYALAARVALRQQAEGAYELLARAQRLRPRLTHALPWLAVQIRLELARAYLTVADAAGAQTMLREAGTLLCRCPDLGTLPAEVEELRASLKTIRAHAPGASTLTEAELRMLPYLATHLSFREIGEGLYVSRHTVKSHAVSIYRKLNVASRNAAVERGRDLGLLEKTHAGPSVMPSG